MRQQKLNWTSTLDCTETQRQRFRKYTESSQNVRHTSTRISQIYFLQCLHSTLQQRQNCLWRNVGRCLIKHSKESSASTWGGQPAALPHCPQFNGQPSSWAGTHSLVWVGVCVWPSEQWGVTGACSLTTQHNAWGINHTCWPHKHSRMKD